MLLVLASVAIFGLAIAPSARPYNEAVPQTSVSVARYAAEADARVEEADPTGNSGSSSYIQADGGGDPEVDSYVRFSVSGLPGLVIHAKLRLYATTSTVNGPSVYPAANDWSEPLVSWQDRPARLGGAIDDSSVIAPGGL